MTTVGEALVHELEARGVSVVFGIPGVHTVELYRGLAASGIRHVTPRHEQGAGFMADGYARAGGAPGVAFVITGPGLTNTITPMAQARADSVPMLVVSGVNHRDSLGRGLGCLHELPDQRGMASLVALSSTRIESVEELAPAIDAAYRRMADGRPGPTHIEVPTDVMKLECVEAVAERAPAARPSPTGDEVAEAARRLSQSRSPVILAGGGARGATAEVRELAERLDAPVVQTINARGLLHAHPLGVPASPSLEAVRDLVADADVVLAVGTEFGPTDYDMYGRSPFPDPASLIRIEICPEQVSRRAVDLALIGDAAEVVDRITTALGDGRGFRNGPERAARAREAALAEIGPEMVAQVAMLDAVRDAMPGAFFIGDSTQAIYAGNLYYDHDRPGGWFNAASGYGALGYAIPAAIGASLAVPGASVVSLAGDGGAQFTLSELMVARQENLPILFLVWNNKGYREIETSMASAGVSVVGCDPAPPDFARIAEACNIPFAKCTADAGALAETVRTMVPEGGPRLIEIEAD